MGVTNPLGILEEITVIQRISTGWERQAMIESHRMSSGRAVYYWTTYFTRVFILEI